MAPQRLVLRHATVVSWNGDGTPTVANGRSVIVERGVIVDIKESQASDLRPGDVLVDAEGKWVVPGMVLARAEAPDRYGSMTRELLRGVTTVAAPFGARRVDWLRRIAATAALPIPALADVQPVAMGGSSAQKQRSAEQMAISAAAELRRRTLDAARDLGLRDRGDIAVGQRADVLIVDRDPLADVDSVEVPIEVILGGNPIRSIALITHRAMIADADRAIAGHSAASEGLDRYEIESSGLRVGLMDVRRDGSSGADWWGPPIEQVTTWTRASMTGGTGWSLDLIEDVAHGFRVSMHLECGAATIFARGQVLRPEELPPAEMTLDATAQAPLLDPISLVRQNWSALSNLAMGASHELDAVEPVPMLGKVRVGVRRLRVVRQAPDRAAIPPEADQRFFLIEDLSAIADDGSGSRVSEFGWVITDRSGVALRAAIVASEGVTEYFLSLPQPAIRSEPQEQRP